MKIANNGLSILAMYEKHLLWQLYLVSKLARVYNSCPTSITGPSYARRYPFGTNLNQCEDDE
jgi:hypothetical protein